MERANLFDDLRAGFRIGQTVLQTAVAFVVKVAPVPCDLAADGLCAPIIAAAHHGVVTAFLLFGDGPRIPIDAELVILEFVGVADHDLLVLEGVFERVAQRLLYTGNPCPIGYMVRLGMWFPIGRDVGVVMFAPFTDDSHLDVGHARVVVPRFAQFGDELLDSLLERRVEISARRRGIVVVRTHFARDVRRPVPAVQVVGMIRVSILRHAAFVRLHPDNKGTRYDFDVHILDAFPAVVAVSDDLVHAVRLDVLHHVPLHVLLDK